MTLIELVLATVVITQNTFLTAAGAVTYCRRSSITTTE